MPRPVSSIEPIAGAAVDPLLYHGGAHNTHNTLHHPHSSTPPPSLSYPHPQQQYSHSHLAATHPHTHTHSNPAATSLWTSPTPSTTATPSPWWQWADEDEAQQANKEELQLSMSVHYPHHHHGGQEPEGEAVPVVEDESNGGRIGRIGFIVESMKNDGFIPVDSQQQSEEQQATEGGNAESNADELDGAATSISSSSVHRPHQHSTSSFPGLVSAPSTSRSVADDTDEFSCPCCGVQTTGGMSYHSHVTRCYMRRFLNTTNIHSQPVSPARENIQAKLHRAMSETSGLGSTSAHMKPVSPRRESRASGHPSSTSTASETEESTDSPPVTLSISSLRDCVNQLDLHQRISLMEAFFRLSRSTADTDTVAGTENPQSFHVDEKVISLLYSPAPITATSAASFSSPASSIADSAASPLYNTTPDLDRPFSPSSSSTQQEHLAAPQTPARHTPHSSPHTPHTCLTPALHQWEMDDHKDDGEADWKRFSLQDQPPQQPLLQPQTSSASSSSSAVVAAVNTFVFDPDSTSSLTEQQQQLLFSACSSPSPAFKRARALSQPSIPYQQDDFELNSFTASVSTHMQQKYTMFEDPEQTMPLSNPIVRSYSPIQIHPTARYSSQPGALQQQQQYSHKQQHHQQQQQQSSQSHEQTPMFNGATMSMPVVRRHSTPNHQMQQEAPVLQSSQRLFQQKMRQTGVERCSTQSRQSHSSTTTTTHPSPSSTSSLSPHSHQSFTSPSSSSSSPVSSTGLSHSYGTRHALGNRRRKREDDDLPMLMDQPA